MADFAYDTLPTEDRAALLADRLRAAELEHYRLSLARDAPVEGDNGGYEKRIEELEESIAVLRDKRDGLEAT